MTAIPFAVAPRDGVAERFESRMHPRRDSSLRRWRDAAPAGRWREHGPHRDAQQGGCQLVDDGHRMRTAVQVRDDGRSQRAQAPADTLAALR